MASAYFGNVVGSAGDLNGDGYDELVMGGTNYTAGQSQEGTVFLFYGSGSGLGANGNPGHANWRIESNQANAALGNDVTGGDFNGDGYSDLVVADWIYDWDETDGATAIPGRSSLLQRAPGCGDGLPDSWELTHGLDPTIDDVGV